jgi:hypothetical protein
LDIVGVKIVKNENFPEWEEPEEPEARRVTWDVGYVRGEYDDVTT